MKKIAFYGAHSGLIRMMTDLLVDFDSKYYDNNVYSSSNPTICSEDIVISTFPYRELSILPENKTIVIYATDPFPDPEIFIRIQSRSNVFVVGDMDGISVYPPALYPIKPIKMIPHAIKPESYPIFTGEIPAIAICNRKPEERFWEITRGIFGRPVNFDEFLSTVPYHILHIPDDKDFFKEISRYRGVFYFSNNPYTLMLFELMVMGMPMVAFGHSRYGDLVMKKYLPDVSTDSAFIQKKLLSYIHTPAKTTYTYYSFEQAKEDWRTLLCSLM